MEHPFVQPIADLFGGDPDPMESAQIDPIPRDVYEQMDDLETEVYSFKKKLYNNRVSGNATQNPQSLQRMNGFHALFLQIVGYWIGTLDDVPVVTPTFTGPTREEDEKKFKTLTKQLLRLGHLSQDARTLVNSLLFQLSTQHPFELGNKISKRNRDDAEDLGL